MVSVPSLLSIAVSPASWWLPPQLSPSVLGSGSASRLWPWPWRHRLRASGRTCPAHGCLQRLVRSWSPLWPEVDVPPSRARPRAVSLLRSERACLFLAGIGFLCISAILLP